MKGSIVARAVCGACCVLVCGTPAGAHHSNAMYDAAKTITLRGVITRVGWTNPHVTFTVMTEGPNGQAGDLWVLESTSPGNLSRVGWTRTSVRTNDRVDVLVAPLRDGSHGGRCRMLTIVETKKSLEC